MRNDKALKGFTLIELMIALTVSGILFAAAMGMFVSNVRQYHKSLSINRLNQQLQTALSVMTDEIRRAGYWSNASNDVGLAQNTNPFMVSGTTDITVGGGNNCILFTYDHNDTGTLPSISSSGDDDRYGFQLNGNTIESRPPGATFACGATDWEKITDSNVVNVTALTFTLNASTVTTGPGTQGIIVRSVDISMTGQLATDSTVTKTLTQRVRIANDKFIP
jgi:prepilin peptidase dependent protein B